MIFYSIQEFTSKPDKHRDRRKKMIPKKRLVRNDNRGSPKKKRKIDEDPSKSKDCTLFKTFAKDKCKNENYNTTVKQCVISRLQLSTINKVLLFSNKQRSKVDESVILVYASVILKLNKETSLLKEELIKKVEEEDRLKKQVKILEENENLFKIQVNVK